MKHIQGTAQIIYLYYMKTCEFGNTVLISPVEDMHLC